MKRVYHLLRTALMAFALGLAAVYMWDGLSIGINSIPVDLPKIDSKDDVLFIFPSTERDASPYYVHTEEEIVDGRDLSLYDEGGYVDSCDAVDNDKWASCRNRREAAREFIFNHWKEKRPGYIQIGHPCVDCSPVDHIFIEPDSNGEFRIVVTLATNGPLRTEQASKARFRRANKEEKRQTDSATILVFVDRNGKELDFF